MSQPEFPTELHLRPRPTITITLNLPTDTFAMVQEVAASRDMSAEALLKLDFIKIRFDFWTAFCVSAKFGSYAARNMFP